eukprot:927285-Rhodomonas_salina.2
MSASAKRRTLYASCHHTSHGIHRHTAAFASRCQDTSAFASIRTHTPVFAAHIRQTAHAPRRNSARTWSPLDS